VLSGVLVPPVQVQTPSPATQTAGIPGTVTLPGGSAVRFSQGSQSLTVVSRIPTGFSGQYATVTYDGAALTIEVPQVRVAEVNVQSPDDRACIYLNGRSNAVRCTVPAFPARAPFMFETVGGHASFPCPDVSLVAGWNLISGALAHNINTNRGPLYTFQTGDQAYEPLATAPDAIDTAGYWVLFDEPASVFDFDLSRYRGCGPPPGQVAGPVTVPLPAGQWVLIGNPFPSATVSGADAVLVYDPTSGYQTTATLSLGQGAWAYSATGGDATLTPIP
jgi:hypothetical protein